MFFYKIMFYGFKKEFFRLNVVFEEYDYGDVDLSGVKFFDILGINFDDRF